MGLIIKENPPAGESTHWPSCPTKTLRDAATFPTGEVPPGQHKKLVSRWLQANEEIRRRQVKATREAFAAKGSAQQWFLSGWTPKNKEQKETCEMIEAAIEVAERLYPPILKRGINHPEDMGVLLSGACGNTEGILAKKAPYSTGAIHLEIHCVTGPWNFDPTDQSTQFEPGAKSHVIHLAYKGLPNQETLQADLCTLPLIKLPPNQTRDTYQSEGLTGPKTKRGIPLHNPWTSLNPNQQHYLIAIFNQTNNTNRHRNTQPHTP
jgi:hypothetical protein